MACFTLHRCSKMLHLMSHQIELQYYLLESLSRFFFKMHEKLHKNTFFKPTEKVLSGLDMTRREVGKWGKLRKQCFSM